MSEQQGDGPRLPWAPVFSNDDAQGDTTDTAAQHTPATPHTPNSTVLNATPAPALYAENDPPVRSPYLNRVAVTPYTSDPQSSSVPTVPSVPTPESAPAPVTPEPPADDFPDEEIMPVAPANPWLDLPSQVGGFTPTPAPSLINELDQAVSSFEPAEPFTPQFPVAESAPTSPGAISGPLTVQDGAGYDDALPKSPISAVLPRNEEHTAPPLLQLQTTTPASAPSVSEVRDDLAPTALVASDGGLTGLDVTEPNSVAPTSPHTPGLAAIPEAQRESFIGAAEHAVAQSQFVWAPTNSADLESQASSLSANTPGKAEDTDGNGAAGNTGTDSNEAATAVLAAAATSVASGGSSGASGSESSEAAGGGEGDGNGKKPWFKKLAIVIPAGVLVLGGVAATVVYLTSDREPGPAPVVSQTIPAPTPTIDPVEFDASTPLLQAIPLSVTDYALTGVEDVTRPLGHPVAEQHLLTYSNGTSEITVTISQMFSEEDATEEAKALTLEDAMTVSDARATSAMTYAAFNSPSQITWVNGSTLIELQSDQDNAEYLFYRFDI